MTDLKAFFDQLIANPDTMGIFALVLVILGMIIPLIMGVFFTEE
ncbi:MAG: hypothetical protein BWX62_00367 [Bacteroidetes bacterium ADurb.Bin037]|nr:MAG: hypothetical protein BWX62_00367 [Bacteroidetes bacterium ADurb.Bin037]HQB56067.1 hypothetical protein [Bacteroidales bacterium]